MTETNPQDLTGAAGDPSQAPAKKGGRRAASRRRLLDAARTLFVEKGYHDTRPQDIAKAAGLGHGTFYIHFTDKRDCFLAFVAEAQDELMGEIAAAGNPMPKSLDEMFTRVFDAIWAYTQKNPGVLQAVMSDPTIIAPQIAPNETIVDVWARDWAAGIQAGVEFGEARPDLDYNLVGYLIVGMLQALVFYSRGDGASPMAARDELIKFITSAIEPRT